MCRAVQGVRTVRGSVTGLRMNLWMTSGWIHNRGGTADQTTPHETDRRFHWAVPLAFRGGPLSRSRSQTDLRQFLLPFGAGLSGPPPGIRDWSILRVLQPLSANGLLNVSLTDSQGAGWGLVRRGEGRRKLLSVHHHCMNNGQPATPPDTHVTSDSQTTWLNMHLRGDLG